MIYFIGVVHFLSFLLMSLYFIIPKNRFDYIYLSIIIFLIIIWKMYNGECPVSYYIKKYLKPDYIAGTNLKSEDLYINKYINLIIPILKVIQIYSIYAVFKRQSIHLYIIITCILLLLSNIYIQNIIINANIIYFSYYFVHNLSTKLYSTHFSEFSHKSFFNNFLSSFAGIDVLFV